MKPHLRLHYRRTLASGSKAALMFPHMKMRYVWFVKGPEFITSYYDSAAEALKAAGEYLK